MVHSCPLCWSEARVRQLPGGHGQAGQVLVWKALLLKSICPASASCSWTILTGTHSALKRGAVVASALHKAPPVFIVLGLAYCAWDQTPARQEVPQLPSAPRLARPGLERPGASQAEANIPMAGDLSLVVEALPEAIVKPLLAARELGFEWIFSHQWDQGYSPGGCPMLQRAPSRHAAMQGAVTPAAHSPLLGQQRRLTLPAWVREGFLTTPH